MTCHNSLKTIVNQACIYLSKGLVPLLTGKSIDAVCNMLISVIQSVSRKMLGCTAKSRIFMGSQQVLGSHLSHLLWIISKVTQTDHRVMPVIINIRKRCKGQITSNGCSLLIGHSSHLKSILWISGGTDFYWMSNQRSVHAGSVAPCFCVTGDNQRYLGIFL